MNLYFLSRPDEKIDQDKPSNIFDVWRPSPICDLEEEDNTPIVHTGILDREGIYCALSQEKKQIRLFQLFPRKSEDLIHGDVFVASLNDKPDYRATRALNNTWRSALMKILGIVVYMGRC